MKCKRKQSEWSDDTRHSASDEAFYEHRDTGESFAGSLEFGATSTRVGLHARTLLFGCAKWSVEHEG